VPLTKFRSRINADVDHCLVITKEVTGGLDRDSNISQCGSKFDDMFH